MGAYTRGTAINLVERFYLIDPLTEAATPADPTTVRFTVHHPDDTAEVFVFGSDSEVTNPEVGVYVCALVPQLPVGSYRYVCVGTGDVVAESWGAFEVLEDGVLAPAASPVPFPGPCTPWIEGDDVAEQCGSEDGVGSNTWLYDAVASAASSLMFSLSGRLFSGVCERTIRPCAGGCGCWTRASGASLASAALYWSGGSWGNECGDRCGCGSEDYLLLSGFPVRDIVEVKVDGAALSASDYRLEENRRLLRLSDPGPPVVRHSWPTCQDLTLNDDQPGTFSVRYRWGIDPPELGRLAAAQLACELYKAQTTGKCALPSRTTRIVRQGVTIDRVPSVAALLREGSTGLNLVDAFIADVNPNKLTRRPAVYSPDIRRGRRSS